MPSFVAGKVIFHFPKNLNTMKAKRADHHSYHFVRSDESNFADG